MRRSEIVQTVRESLVVSDLALSAEQAIRIATALGVVVEPDDAPLPKGIVTTQGGYTPHGYGLGFTTDDKSWRGYIEIRLDCPIDENAGRRIAVALVDAYNNRQSEVIK